MIPTHVARIRFLPIRSSHAPSAGRIRAGGCDRILLRAGLGSVLSTVVALEAFAGSSPATAQEGAGAATPQASPPPAPSARVERGDLPLRVEVDGTLDAAERAKVRLVLEKYGGPLAIAEVIPPGRHVAVDEVVLRLETTEIDEQIRRAEESLDSARRGLAATDEEGRISADREALGVERGDWGRDRAKRERDAFLRTEGERMVQSAELSRMGSEANVEDQKEELEQLESMYRKSELAEETKEIVLERAKRSVRIADGWLEIAKVREQNVKETGFPLRRETVEREARFAEVDAALAARSRDAAAVRRDLARVDAERRARDAAEDLEKLRRDRAKLEMRAPRAGIVTHAELEPGATVAARQVLFEVLEPDTHVAKAAVPAADLRTVLDGVVAKVRLESLGGVEVTGELVEVGWTASEKDAAGDGKYAIRLRLPVEPSPLRPGMKVRVLLEGNAPLQGVLSIPRKAVFAKDGRSVAFVPSEGGPGERALVVGRGNPDRVEIVSGLAEGDEVLLERPAGK